jgi:hypothetical protein
MTRRRALATLAAMPAWGRTSPRLERTFLQPWRRHLEWSAAQWGGLLDWLRALPVRQVALQWTLWNGVDYTELAAALESELASRRMKLWLGLAFDEEFWRWSVTPGTETAGRLKQFRERSLEQAHRLAAGPAMGRAFAGWYLPEEFDAARWNRLPDEVSRHLSATRQALTRMVRKPVAVSGFPSASPGDAAAFWSAAVFREAADELWMQDGIGAGKSTLEQWPGWASQVAHSVRRTRCRMSVVVETFEAAGGQGFKAKPAPIERVRRQIEEAARVSDGPLGAFEVPEYMSPAGVEGAEALGRAYASVRGSKLPDEVPSNTASANR